MKSVAVVLALALFATVVVAGGSRPCADEYDRDCEPPSSGGHGHHDRDCDDEPADVSFYSLNHEQCPAVDLQLLNIVQWTVKLKGDTLEAWFKLLVSDPANFIIGNDYKPKGGIGSVVSSSCNPTLALAATGPEPLDLKASCSMLYSGVYQITGKVEIAKKSALTIARDANKRGTFVIVTTFTTPGGKVVGCVRSLVGFCSAPATGCDAAAGTSGSRKHHHDDDDDEDDDVNLSRLQCGECGCGEPIVTKCARLLGLRNSCGQGFGQSEDKCCFKNCCALCAANEDCNANTCQCTPKAAACAPETDPGCKSGK